MPSIMNTYNVFSAQNKAGFGDEAGADLASFLDLSFTDSSAIPLPTPTLFPISTAPSFSNAFASSLRQQDALLDSPLGLSPASLAASPLDFSYDFTSPLLSGSFSTPDSIDGGLGTPELGHGEEFPSLFYNVAAPTASPQWNPSDLAAFTSTVSAPVSSATALAISPSMMRLDSERLLAAACLVSSTVLTQEQRDAEDAASRQAFKDKFNGTRNTKIKPIDFNAPTLPKNYILPSATSRKRAPAAISAKLTGPAAKKGKRARRDSTPLPEDEPLDPEDIPDELLSAIELKRRQNTLAARRSRMRKAGHLAELKDEIDGLKSELEQWKAKYAELEEVLRARV